MTEALRRWGRWDWEWRENQDESGNGSAWRRVGGGSSDWTSSPVVVGSFDTGSFAAAASALASAAAVVLDAAAVAALVAAAAENDNSVDGSNAAVAWNDSDTANCAPCRCCHCRRAAAFVVACADYIPHDVAAETAAPHEYYCTASGSATAR